MHISTREFGKLSDGRAVTCWQLTNEAGSAVEVLDYGAATRSVEVLGRSVCMGFDRVEPYEARTTYSGTIVGRHAGRIGGTQIELNGAHCQLAAVDGPNNHHGGSEGFSHKLWQVECIDSKLVCSLTSPHGEEGFPGTLNITVTYQWTGDATLSVTFDAVCDRDTVASFTHHGYWNLSGNTELANHLYQVHAPTVVAVDENTLPTGELPPVEGTPFDFRTPRPLGDMFLDHTFPVPGEGMRELGSLAGDGMKVTVSSTLPALHIYTGVGTHAALEAQFIPDAIHHSNFPSTILRAGDRWHHVIEYRFEQA